MANTISNEYRKYFDRLTATSPICVSYGGVFTSGTNLFVNIEPSSATKCITVIGYGGAPPRPDNNRYESGVQIRLKIRNKEKGIRTMQEIINRLHENTDICASANSKTFAVQSSPALVDTYEGGQYVAYVANFICKHIKL